MRQGWTVVNVGDVAEQIRGVTYLKGDAQRAPSPNLVPILRAGNITNDGIVLDNLVYVPESKVSSKQFLSEGDVLIAASSGSLDVVGKAGRIHEGVRAGFGAFCKVLRPGSSVDSRYFAHYFKTSEYRRTVSRLAAGANINNLRNGDLDNLALPLPSLDEQRRIAAVLDQVDRLRVRRKQSVRMWDDAVDALFAQVTGGQREPIGDLADLQGGLTIGPKRAEYPGEMAYLRVANVMRGRLDLAEVKTVRVTEKEAARTRLASGDILVVEGHGNVHEIGRAAMWSGNLPGDVSHQNHLFRLRPDASRVLSKYLVNFLNAMDGRRQIRAITTTTSGLNTISSSKLKTLQMRVPPLSAQRQFAAQVAQIEMVRATAERHLTDLDALCASLQSRAFAGDLDVSKVILPS